MGASSSSTSSFKLKRPMPLNENCKFFEICHFLTTVDARLISSNNCMQIQVIQMYHYFSKIKKSPKLSPSDERTSFFLVTEICWNASVTVHIVEFFFFSWLSGCQLKNKFLLQNQHLVHQHFLIPTYWRHVTNRRCVTRSWE